MSFYDLDFPIIACSSGISENSAIGIIRISGFDKLSNFKHLLSFLNGPIEPKEPEPKRSYRTTIESDDIKYDDALVLWFKAPNSFTGENILELYVHGNQLNIKRIMELFVSRNLCRYARAGEFSFRAMKNKKLNLSQVEGLDLFLNAQTELSLNQGFKSLNGELYAEYLKLRDKFIDLRSAIELSIDFAEDIGDERSELILKEKFSTFFDFIERLNRRIAGNLSSLTNPTIVLFGQTNAGKSSFFNKFLSSNRAIVSERAGTTRDYISEYISISGSNFKLLDTAGVRATSDFIEEEGIKFSWNLARESFFKILLINPFETDTKILSDMASVKFDFLLITHGDCAGFNERLSALKLPSADFTFITSLRLDNFAPIGPVDKLIGPIEPVDIILKKLRANILEKYSSLVNFDPILIPRHRAKISGIYEISKEFQVLMEDSTDIAILSSQINIIDAQISELIGVVAPNDVLNHIFGNFCIGK